jgi:hypothetical protein
MKHNRFVRYSLQKYILYITINIASLLLILAIVFVFCRCDECSVGSYGFIYVVFASCLSFFYEWGKGGDVYCYINVGSFCAGYSLAVITELMIVLHRYRWSSFRPITEWVLRTLNIRLWKVEKISIRRMKDVTVEVEYGIRETLWDIERQGGFHHINKVLIS